MSDLNIRMRDLVMHYGGSRRLFGSGGGGTRAIDGVSLDIPSGETLALVGESGSGKSTLGRIILQLQKPTSGQVFFGDTELTALSESGMKPFRREMQMVFQDPQSSLNPRMRIGEILGEPLLVHGIERSAKERRKRVLELLDIVKLPASAIDRYPRDFSGGQRQRVGIARALALRPKFIISDEAVSALDVSIQAQIVNLLIELQRDMGLTHLFIAHDLAVVRQIADRIAVMRLGRIVEYAPCRELFSDPLHPYTRSLIRAAPIPDPRADRIRRDDPDEEVFAGGPEPETGANLVEAKPGHFIAENALSLSS